jgi:hypothetical protein
MRAGVAASGVGQTPTRNRGGRVGKSPTAETGNARYQAAQDAATLHGMKKDNQSRAGGDRSVLPGMITFVVVGTPLVFYLWTVLNDVLAGEIDGARLALAVPALALFAALVFLLGRAVTRWNGPEPADPTRT